MFVALGAGVYSAGIFHLFTHAFFKALLFLGAGSVIHAMHHEQDMRKMGGLTNKIPDHLLADDHRHAGADRRRHPGHRRISALPASSRKDSIIEAAYAVGGTAGTFAFWLLVVAALFTSFYSWRLIHLTFHGKPRWSAAATRTSPPGRTGMTITRMPTPRTTTMATATRSSRTRARG